MPDLSKLTNSLAKFEQIKEANPLATHIYLRRPDGEQVDIPVGQVEFTLRQHPEWDVEDVGIATNLPRLGNAPVSSEPVEVPERPSAQQEKPEEAPERAPVNLRMARADIETIAIAEGITQEEIDAAASKGDLVELVNARRGA